MRGNIENIESLVINRLANPRIPNHNVTTVTAVLTDKLVARLIATLLSSKIFVLCYTILNSPKQYLSHSKAFKHSLKVMNSDSQCLSNSNQGVKRYLRQGRTVRVRFKRSPRSLITTGHQSRLE